MLRKASMTAAISKSEPERLTRLSDLCSEAAGHVARARMALNVETFDTDQALAHLDDAIGCLRRLLAHSKTGRQAATVHTPQRLTKRPHATSTSEKRSAASE